MKPSPNTPKRIHFVANCVYGDHLAGGDIHFFHMAEAAIDAGFSVNFFGGHALKQHLADRKIAADITLTDHKKLGPINMSTLTGQLRLLFDYLGRFLRTLKLLSRIRPEDLVYGVTEYWFDVFPLLLCKAKGKVMIWHMQAPTLTQIILKDRPDVDTARVASLHYWLSQNLSISLFRYCKRKFLLYVHPDMHNQLIRKGYRQTEIGYISFGVEIPRISQNHFLGKKFDVVWIGRIHRQKGIEDLLACLSYLANQVKGFRAVLVGNLRTGLEPRIKALKLADSIEFAGFVSEEEKFKIFRSSRVFLMPSRFEGSPRTVAEALVCNVPVVAYDLATYHPIFGSLLCYVPCFDLKRFQQEAEFQIQRMRDGVCGLGPTKVEEFGRTHAWSATQKVFLQAVNSLC